MLFRSTREKAHFMRVSEHEWQIARDQLAEGFNAETYTAASTNTEGQNR